MHRSPNIVREIKSRILRWAGQVARMEEDRCAFKILTRRRLLGRPRGRWKEIIRLDLKEIGINTRNLVVSAEKELVRNPCECCIEPPGSNKP